LRVAHCLWPRSRALELTLTLFVNQDNGIDALQRTSSAYEAVEAVESHESRVQPHSAGPED
jgi:hypothetical protein